MSTTPIAFIRAQNPEVFVTRFLQVAEAAFKGNSLRISVETSLPSVRLEVNGTAEALSATRETVNFKSTVENRDYLRITQTSLHIMVSGGTWQERLRFSAAPPNRGYFTQPQPGPPESSLAILDALHEHFDLISESVSASLGVDEASRAALDAQEALVAEISRQLEHLTKLASTQVITQTTHLQQLESQLRGSFLTKESELESRFQSRASTLDTREQSLLGKEKEFDLRQNTYVRRANFDEAKKLLKEQAEFRLSPSVGEKRTVIHRVCWLALLGFGTLAGTALYQMASDTAVRWHIVPLASAGILGFTATLIFYIRWSDDWFSQHAAAERLNKKMQSDIIRANWLAELLFEWAKDRKEPIPVELITKLSHGLFEGASEEGTLHPVEDVSAAVGRVTALRVGPQGLQMKLGRAKNSSRGGT